MSTETAAKVQPTAFDMLTAELAAAKAGADKWSSVYPDELGGGLEQVSDFKVIGTRRTQTVRLDVWREPGTDSYAGVRYLHHDEHGTSDVEIVHVELVTEPAWKVTA